MSTNASRHSVELTPELYRNLRGPYNRRNVYGAALSYGPVLSLNEHTSKMFESVSEFALCREEGLLSELNLDRDSIESIALRYLPRQRNINPRYSQLLEVDCES